MFKYFYKIDIFSFICVLIAFINTNTLSTVVLNMNLSLILEQDFNVPT